MAAVKPTLYREVLTPALHRRFTSSALLVLAFCYIEAILLAEKSSFIWTWFPVGPAGIRALLLFISALSIFVLRVATLHMGSRTSNSPSSFFIRAAFQPNTLLILSWYLFSAWWFSEVYLWSASASSDLKLIAQGKAWERRRLNERPIYLRSVLLLLAVAQSTCHICYDYDNIPLPIEPHLEERLLQQPSGVSAWCSTTKDILKPMFVWNPTNLAKSVPENIILRTLAICLSAPFLYGIFIRRTAWNWSLAFASLLWDVPASQLSYIPPHYPSLVYRSITAGALLMFLWQSSNALFTAYVARQPIKKAQPLSNESKDPNGTLLNGLRSRKHVANTFALWELSLITSNFLDRRKTIFTDIDRPLGSAWTQTSMVCLRNISILQSRIYTFLNPPEPTNSSSPANQQQTAKVESLPRISTPLRRDNIFSNAPAPATSLEKIESNVGNLAKSYGQSPAPGTLKLPYSPQATSLLSSSGQKLLSSPAKKILTPGQQERLASSGLRGIFDEYMMNFLRSPFGQPFRQTFSRRISTILLGSPHSTTYGTLAAIKSLTTLAVASLNEDPYGRVSKDVPTIIQTYTSTVQSVEAFCKNLPPHWTDVDFEEAEREVDDVNAVIACLKNGLRTLVQEFGPYAGELGIGETEVRNAKKVAGGFDDDN